MTVSVSDDESRLDITSDEEKRDENTPPEKATMMQEKIPTMVAKKEENNNEDPSSLAHIATRFSEKEITVRQVAPLVLVLTGATFMTTIAAQSVVIIIPVMSRDLDIPETRQQWIVSAYALTSGSFLLLCGKLGDVYGKRILFIMGGFFITATAIATAFAPEEISLYIFRALHGLGSAITIPTAIGIIGYTIPPGRVKNYSFAFYSGGAPTGQVMGNLLGGIISQFASWKVVFFVIAGASFIIAFSAIFVIPKEPPRVKSTTGISRASGVDWVGAFFFTVGLLLLLVALSEGVSAGWSTTYVIALLIISVVLLIAFTFWEHHRENKTDNDPLMRISTFKNSKFSFAMVIITFFSAGFTNFLIYSTYYYQDFQGLDPLQTTVRYIPVGVVGMLTTIASGYLLARVLGNYILIFGLSSALIANLLFSVPIPPSTSYFAYGFISMCLAAFGADTVYPCLGLYTTQSLPRKDQGVAGAIFQTMASIGRSMSLPITAAVQTAVQEKGAKAGKTEKEAFLGGLRAVEWFCVACMGLALFITVFGLRKIGKIGLLKKLGQVQTKEVKEEAIGSV